MVFRVLLIWKLFSSVFFAYRLAIDNFLLVK